MRKKKNKLTNEKIMDGTVDGTAEAEICSKKKNKKTGIKILILIALIIVIVILMLTKCDGVFRGNEMEIVPIESTDSLNYNPDDIKLRINTMPTVKKGVVRNLNLENCNEGTYMLCSLVLDGEEVHTLGPIQCGEKIKSCRLYENKLFGGRRLEAGDYYGYAMVFCIDEDGKNERETVIGMMFHVIK